MIIIEHEGTLLTKDQVRTSVYSSDGSVKAGEESLISEYVLIIFINSKPAFKVVCTPSDLPELTAGRLITEAGIDPSDIEKIDICRLGNAARVTVRSGAAALLKEGSVTEVSTCCTGNRTFLSSDDSLTPLPEADFDLSRIPLILRKAEEDTDLHRATGSSHSAILMCGDRIVYEADDIGRHNAVDKAVGYLYINGLDPSSAAVYTTGRMPTDMIRKVIRAGIPVLLSRQRPTAEGVEMASRYNLRLIGCLRPGSFKSYT